MTCPCCGSPMTTYDGIEAGSVHPTAPRGTPLWTVWRCSTCADDTPETCTCEDGGIYNDRHGTPEPGYGCAL